MYVRQAIELRVLLLLLLLLLRSQHLTTAERCTPSNQWLTAIYSVLDRVTDIQTYVRQQQLNTALHQ